MMGGLLLSGCGASTATPPAAMVTVTCPARSCSAATIALTKVTRPGQGYPGPEAREGLPAVTPGPTATVAPTRTGITCDAAFQAALGGWAVVAMGTAPGRPWSLTLPLPAIRAPREVAG